MANRTEVKTMDIPMTIEKIFAKSKDIIDADSINSDHPDDKLNYGFEFNEKVLTQKYHWFFPAGNQRLYIKNREKNDGAGFILSLMSAAYRYINEKDGEPEDFLDEIGVEQVIDAPSPTTGTKIFVNRIWEVFDGQHRIIWLTLFMLSRIGISSKEIFGVERTLYYNDIKKHFPEIAKAFEKIQFTIHWVDSVDKGIISSCFVDLNNGSKNVTKDEILDSEHYDENAFKFKRLIKRSKGFAGSFRTESLSSFYSKNFSDIFLKNFLVITNNYMDAKPQAQALREKFWTQWDNKVEVTLFKKTINSILNLYNAAAEYPSIVEACGNIPHVSAACMKFIYENNLSKELVVSGDFRYLVPDSNKISSWLNKNSEKLAKAIVTTRNSFDENFRINDTTHDYKKTMAVYNKLSSCFSGM